MNFKFDTWQCPKCGWVMADALYKRLNYDFCCPRCESVKLSEFKLAEYKRLLADLDKRLCEALGIPIEMLRK